MAFAFLDTLGSIAKLGASAAALFGGRRNISKEIPTLQPSIDAAEAARVFGLAAANPDDPMFQNLASLFQEKIRRDTLSSIKEIIRQNNRAQARGAVGLGINPDRRDEAISSAIATQNELAKEQARLSARDYLLAASQGQAQAAQGFSGTFQPFQQFGDIAANQRASRLRALGEFPGQLSDVFRNAFGGSGVSLGGLGSALQARSGSPLNGSISSTVNPGTNYYNRYQPRRVF